MPKSVGTQCKSKTLDVLREITYPLGEQGKVRSRRHAMITLSGRKVKMNKKASMHRKNPYVIIYKEREKGPKQIIIIHLAALYHREHSRTNFQPGIRLLNLGGEWQIWIIVLSRRSVCSIKGFR